MIGSIFIDLGFSTAAGFYTTFFSGYLGIEGEGAEGASKERKKSPAG